MSLLLLLLLGWLPLPQSNAALEEGGAQPETGEKARRVVQAARLGEPLAVDGVLDEGAWQQAPLIAAFVQRDPVEGAAPTERTEVRVLYDNEALYIGARLYDSAPDSITARLGRRDAQLEADRFGFFIDPYLDRRSGYYFAINAAGTLYDGVLLNDDWDDDSWDGVWEGRARVDAQGWTAELRIPFSQLRFYRRQVYTWGINFRRDIARKQERDYLVYTPRNESGFVSRFADLTGVQDITPPRQVELLPYVTARAEYTHPDAGNPFNDGSRYVPEVGADFKVGLTPNLTLNATVNPDFGQVEVDPAVVNLSDVETFFQEKRPFFVEGASVFNFGYGGSRSNWGFNFGNPNFFYSRRIGHAPQGDVPDADFADVPDGTRILGAAKLTGKVGGGWNMGMIHALTNRETARLQQDGTPRSAEVEPLAYYGVLRSQKEFREGYRAIGFISTVTARDFREPALRDVLNSEAYTAGLDGWTFLDADRTWVITGWAGLSHVRGTRERLLALQQSAQHYFQRPDAHHVRVDSSATSLTGFAGRVLVNKQRGNVIVNAALGVIDPSFDVNDVGFQWRTDVINAHVGGGYRWTEPGRLLRQATLLTAAFRSLDFDGNTTWTGVWGLADVQFLNYYNLFLNGAYNPRTVNDRRTRGGPLTLNPPGWEVNFGLRSDSRKAWVFGTDFSTYQAAWQRFLSVGVELEWKPAPNVALTLNPRVEWNDDHAQWVDAFDDPLAAATYGRRYVFAELDQVTASSSVRLNWTFTPKLSFQLFTQPLLSAGDYTRYKELARPRSYAFNVYGEGVSTFSQDTFLADPDGDGPAAPLQLSDQNFNLTSLRGTAVLRWEFRPGSTLYLVWTQTRGDSDTVGDFTFGPSFRRLWNVPADNIFLVKLTYWLSR